jgi:NAD+ synthase (glutamine-hydrolysing)
MIKAACAELGVRGFAAKLSYIPDIKRATSEATLCRQLLTCVYQGTRNSSVETRRAAAGVAKELRATFYDLDVDRLVESYTDLIAGAMKRKLSWRKHDTALQNIQARVRAPSVWLIANLQRALLLVTSNRSEASVGYTTMDGDSSGGLCPLGGIDKAYLREWLRWLEVKGPDGLTNYPSLKRVNVQAPTAELRPLLTHQTDERDLMPYVVLDSIERRAVRDKLMPLAVLERISEEFRGSFSRKQLTDWVERFFRLWSMNQWKRERLAPSFHVDDESVDPKTWCRFPILSGGFERELAMLRSKRR